ncbi:MAG: hypothetical protein P4L46_15420 [Fimbriimonas sp.]|nr:hypothetical protein [Fimbriimonas sp.]
MSKQLTDHTVAVFASHEEADAAIKALTDAGHDIRHLSVIGQDYATEARPIGFVNTGDRIVSWGKLGAFWGSLWGLFLGSAMLFIPGLGYVMFAGWLVAALEGAAIGVSVGALAGALISLGIPDNSVVKYEWAVRDGHFLLIVHGGEEEAIRAKQILDQTSASNVSSFTTRQDPSAPGALLSSNDH